jgi:putative endonuclease
MNFTFWKKQPGNTGSFGEQVATEYLKKKGYRILERNYANAKGRRLGELDIIAEYDGEIVFVEVKTRKWETGAPLPEESVNRVKLHRLEKIATSYLRAKKKETVAYHFDVIALFLDSLRGEVLEIRHLERVFL